MPKLRARAFITLDQFTVEYYTASDACTDREQYTALIFRRRAEFCLAKRRRIRVVRHRHSFPRQRGQFFGERHVIPTVIRPTEYHAAITIHHPRGTNADRFYVVKIDFGFFRVTPDTNELCVFAVNRGNIKKRFDVINTLYSQTQTSNKGQKVALGSLTIDEPCYGTSATAIERMREEQPKYIRITDFDDFGIEKNHKYMTAELYAEKHFLKRNDILFARSGSIGRTYFYDGSIGKAVFAGYCIRFRFDENKVIPKYAYWCTKTGSYQNWVKGIQRSAVQPNINKEKYKSFEITLPCLEEQKKLVDFMDKAFLSYRQTIKQAEIEWQSAKEQFEKELLQ